MLFVVRRRREVVDTLPRWIPRAGTPACKGSRDGLRSRQRSRVGEAVESVGPSTAGVAFELKRKKRESNLRRGLCSLLVALNPIKGPIGRENTVASRAVSLARCN